MKRGSYVIFGLTFITRHLDRSDRTLASDHMPPAKGTEHTLLEIQREGTLLGRRRLDLERQKVSKTWT